MKIFPNQPKVVLRAFIAIIMLSLGLMIPDHSLAHFTSVSSQPHIVQSNEPGVWTRYANNPVMAASQEWEGGLVWSAHVLKDDTVYKMWYTGVDSGTNEIGYATSPDGLAWAKLTDNPVLVPGSAGAWDGNGVATPFVLHESGIYKMWYWGINTEGIKQIGYATSPDGIAWIKYPENPVLTVGEAGSWDELEAAAPWVIHQGSTYQMWYTGQAYDGKYALGYATSVDGIQWTKDSSSPFLIGTPGSWDQKGVCAASVFFDGVKYRLWYFGKDETGTDRIGYATSPDGLTWTKDDHNPVLELGPEGAWDSVAVSFPKVMLDNHLYKMWYLGSDGSASQVGYATAPEMIQSYLPIVLK